MYSKVENTQTVFDNIDEKFALAQIETANLLSEIWNMSHNLVV